MEDLERRMIDDALRGRRQGFDFLMTRYGRHVHLLVSQLLSDARDAEEAAQDTFVRAFGSLSTFDPRRGSFASWIGRIAWNTALNALQGKGEVGLDLLENIDYLDKLEDMEPDNRTLILLDKAIDRLKPEERTLLHLRYYEGKTLGEIAEITDIETGPLASRLHRIRKKLSKLMGL